MKRKYPVLGVIAALCYGIAVIVGGYLARASYSHIIHAISELALFLEVENVLRIDFLFRPYGWLLLLFGLAMARDFYKQGMRMCTNAGILLAVNGAAGLLMEIFPMDIRGAEATFSGQVHLVLAGVCALASILPPLLIGLHLRKRSIDGSFARYSMISSLIIFVSGGFSAAGAANQFIYFGLIERITIGTFITWLFCFSLYSLGGFEKEKLNVKNPHIEKGFK